MVVAVIAELVRSFYDDLWNRWDDALVPTVLSPTFEFRGSLGTVSIGRDGWLDYRQVVRSGSADFHNELVVCRLQCLHICNPSISIREKEKRKRKERGRTFHMPRKLPNHT